MSGPVAAGPGVPVNDKPPGQGPGGEGGEQSLDLRDGQRDHAGLGGRRLVGPDRGRCLGVGAVSRDFTGSARCGRDPLPGADQHVPGLVSHIGQMNGVDPVGHLPRTPPGTGVSRPGSRRLFPDRSRRSRRSPSRLAARAVPPLPGRRPRTGVPRSSRRRCLSSRGSKPLGPVRCPVPAMPGDTPLVHPRQLADQRRHVLARLQPRLCPGKTRPQQRQQLIPFPQPRPGTPAFPPDKPASLPSPRRRSGQGSLPRAHRGPSYRVRACLRSFWILAGCVGSGGTPRT